MSEDREPTGIPSIPSNETPTDALCRAADSLDCIAELVDRLDGELTLTDCGSRGLAYLLRGIKADLLLLAGPLEYSEQSSKKSRGKRRHGEKTESCVRELEALRSASAQ